MNQLDRGQLITLAVCGGIVLILFTIAIGWFVDSIGSKPQPQRVYPTGKRPDDPQDAILYHKITRLVKFFVRRMNEVGNPGLTGPPHWINPSASMSKLYPRVTGVPMEIQLPSGAWWYGYSCIAPGGQWEYYARCVCYREGTSDEFGAWWVVSSDAPKHSLIDRDTHPFNMYKVYDAGDATLQHAYKTMSTMMEQLLSRHRPEALAQFRALRDS